MHTWPCPTPDFQHHQGPVNGPRVFGGRTRRFLPLRVRSMIVSAVTGNTLAVCSKDHPLAARKRASLQAKAKKTPAEKARIAALGGTRRDYVKERAGTAVGSGLLRGYHESRNGETPSREPV